MDNHANRTNSPMDRGVSTAQPQAASPSHSSQHSSSIAGSGMSIRQLLAKFQAPVIKAEANASAEPASEPAPVSSEDDHHKEADESSNASAPQITKLPFCCTITTGVEQAEICHWESVTSDLATAMQQGMRFASPAVPPSAQPQPQPAILLRTLISGAMPAAVLVAQPTFVQFMEQPESTRTVTSGVGFYGFEGPAVYPKGPSTGSPALAPIRKPPDSQLKLRQPPAQAADKCAAPPAASRELSAANRKMSGSADDTKPSKLSSGPGAAASRVSAGSKAAGSPSRGPAATAPSPTPSAVTTEVISNGVGCLVRRRVRKAYKASMKTRKASGTAAKRGGKKSASAAATHAASSSGHTARQQKQEPAVAEPQQQQQRRVSKRRRSPGPETQETVQPVRQKRRGAPAAAEAPVMNTHPAAVVESPVSSAGSPVMSVAGPVVPAGPSARTSQVSTGAKCSPCTSTAPVTIREESVPAQQQLQACKHHHHQQQQHEVHQQDAGSTMQEVQPCQTFADLAVCDAWSDIFLEENLFGCSDQQHTQQQGPIDVQREGSAASSNSFVDMWDDLDVGTDSAGAAAAGGQPTGSAAAAAALYIAQGLEPLHLLSVEEMFLGA